MPLVGVQTALGSSERSCNVVIRLKYYQKITILKIKSLHTQPSFLYVGISACIDLYNWKRIWSTACIC